MADKKRLFLAVNLSVPTTRELAGAVAAMKSEAAKKGLKVAWVPPTNLHVTLKFLGSSNPEVVDAVRDRLRAGLAGRKGITLEARGVGAFPNEEAARVLWAGIAEPAGALAKLAVDVDGWMEGLGWTRETRPFHAHVTLGRVKDGHGAEAVLAPYRSTVFGVSLVREVVLYETQTHGKVSEYVALARVGLDAPPFKAERIERPKEPEGERERDD